MDKDKYITEEVKEILEKAMKEGLKVEMRPMKRNDGTKQVGIFEVVTRNLKRNKN